ncbi:hypothetical protein SPV_2486 [Streptococcus pneumoniae]|nr:hypothetical protein SPV_2486 [Streptococcus pneumoniae]
MNTRSFIFFAQHPVPAHIG